MAVKESFHKPGSVAKETDPDQRWKNYRGLLDESAKAKLAVDRTLYMKKSRNIYDLFRKMSPEKRSEYLQYFSLKNALPESQKSEHTMLNCDACQVHHFAMQSFFPNGAKLKPQKLVQNVLAENASKANSKVKPTQKDMKSAVKHIPKLMHPFRKFLKSALLKLKQKYQSLNFRKRKTRLKKNANVDNAYAKKNKSLKKNGPNKTWKRCW